MSKSELEVAEVISLSTKKWPRSMVGSGCSTKPVIAGQKCVCMT